MLSDAELLAIRNDFPIFDTKVYVATCSQGALSRTVELGLQEHISSWHKLGMGWDVWIEKYEEARHSFADLIGADVSEVAVLTSASAGINAIASALDFRNRNKVVIGEFEFPTMGHVWMAQQKRGAEVCWVRQCGGRIPAERYAREISEKTCIVPITGVCFMNGARSEIRAITQYAHEKGALVMVDDYQDCGTRPVNVKELGVDFYVSGTLKYLLGGSGLAFMYVRRDLIGRLNPTISSWIAQAEHFGYHLERFDLAPTARRFEVGTPAVQPIYAVLPALDLLKRVGLQRIQTHVHHLASALIRNAQGLRVELKTLLDSVGPLVVLKTRDINQVLRKFEEAHIVASSRYDGLRVSFHLYNSIEDVAHITRIIDENLDLFVTSRVTARA